jgi:hypothetical protein
MSLPLCYVDEFQASGKFLLLRCPSEGLQLIVVSCYLAVGMTGYAHSTCAG